MTYTISVLIILLAMGVAYKFLPARAAEPMLLDEDAEPTMPVLEWRRSVTRECGEIDEPSDRDDGDPGDGAGESDRDDVGDVRRGRQHRRARCSRNGSVCRSRTG